MRKFYLHDVAVPFALPAGSSFPAGTSPFGTPTFTFTGAATNRWMDEHIGRLQIAAGPQTLNASTVAQSVWFRRFLSSPLSAQTIASAAWSFHGASSQSNTNSNLALSARVGFWRPSTGVFTGVQWSVTLAAPGTTETAANAATAPGSSITLADGDLLIVELWRLSISQAKATAYTNTAYYDGTTEDSATTNAVYLLAPVDLPLLLPNKDWVEDEIRSDPFSLQTLDRASVARGSFFCLGEKWARKGRLLVPSADRPFALAGC